MSRLSYRIAVLLALAPAPVAAQVIPLPLGNSSIAPEPQVTPTPAPTVAPTPTATPTPDAEPAPTPSPTRARVAPVREPRARPSPEPTPVATPTPEAAPSPTPTANPLPTPAATQPAAAPPSVPARSQGLTLWPFMVGGALLLLGLVWALRRRRAEPEEGSYVEEEEVAPEPDPASEAAAIDVVAPAPTPSPQLFQRRAAPVASALRVDFRPTRAGLNILSATVEGEVTVTNTGPVPVADIRAAVVLLSAHAGQDTELAELGAAPVGRPTVPAFALAPGEARAFRAVVALPHDRIVSLTAAGRPMFVPLVAVTLRHGAQADTAAWAVGVERVDSAKLAPLWLDVPPRSYEAVGARPHH